MEPATMIALAPLVMGALKGKEDKKLAEEDLYITAARERMAPLTGMRPNQNPRQVSSIGPLMQGAVASADMYQDMQRNAQMKDFIKAYDNKGPAQFNPTFNLYDQGQGNIPQQGQQQGAPGMDGQGIDRRTPAQRTNDAAGGAAEFKITEHTPKSGDPYNNSTVLRSPGAVGGKPGEVPQGRSLNEAETAPDAIPPRELQANADGSYTDIKSGEIVPPTQVRKGVDKILAH